MTKCEQSLIEKSRDVQSNLLLAFRRLKEGDYDGALSSIDRAISLNVEAINGLYEKNTFQNPPEKMGPCVNCGKEMATHEQSDVDPTVFRCEISDNKSLETAILNSITANCPCKDHLPVLVFSQRCELARNIAADIKEFVGGDVTRKQYDALLQLLGEHHEWSNDRQHDPIEAYDGTILKWATEQALQGKPWGNFITTPKPVMVDLERCAAAAKRVMHHEDKGHPGAVANAVLDEAISQGARFQYVD